MRDERGSDDIVKIVASNYRDRKGAPDLVSHWGNNTPKQVYDKDADSDRLISALKAALKVRHVTMRQLSDSLHIPYRSLQNYFSGESRLPADVLLAICNDIGIEADYLAKGSFELSHFDLYDAVLKVFDELLPHVRIKPSGKAALRIGEPATKAEVASAAYALTLQINEAYASFRDHSVKTGIVRPVTSSEHKTRRRRSKVGQ